MGSHMRFDNFRNQLFSQAELAPGGLLDVFARNASWIWAQEAPPYVDQSPQAPGGEQRAFRKVWSNVDLNKAPVSATLVVAADNYCAIYVSGILLHAIDDTDDWNEPLAFHVPVDPDTAQVTFGIRVVNKRGDLGEASSPAGLRVAGKITFSDGSTETFFTGSDQTWLVATLFDEGWEQKQFDDRTWRPAVLVVQTSVWGALNVRPETVAVADKIPTPTSHTPGSSSSETGSSPPTSGVVSGLSRTNPPSGQHLLGSGELAGVIIGPVLLTLAVTALLTFLFTRRRYKSRFLPDNKLYTPYETRPMREVGSPSTPSN